MGRVVAESNWPIPSRDSFARACGETAIGAIITGIVWAIPTGMRVAGVAEGSALSFIIPFAGIATVPALGGIAIARAATLAARKLVPDPRKRSLWLSVLSVWLMLSTGALYGFATVLTAVTHHRGLGGTTFAVVGIGISLVIALMVYRLAQWLESTVRRAIVAWGLFALTGGVVAYVLYLAVRGASAAGTAEPALAVVDTAVFTGLVVVGARIRLPASHMRVWIPASVFAVIGVVVLGVSTIHDVVSAGRTARAKVLVAAPALRLLARPDTKPKRRPKARGGAPRASAPAPTSAAIALPEASASPSQPSPRAVTRVDKPDIIVVTLDTVRADHLGTYGYKRPTSTNLDALAKRSVVFDRAYAAGPETRTAIAPLVTGKYLFESVRDDRDWPTLLRANETVAEQLRGGGYATGAVTSFQWLSKARGFDQGFDLFDEGPFRRVHPEREVTGAHAVAQAMAAYDKLRASNKPVFLWVHLFDAHETYNKHEGPSFGAEYVDLYDGELAYIDRELQRLIEHVESGPRKDQTVWIVHGSHGEAFGEHGFTGHPPKMFDEVVRVPLIVRVPWAAPRRVALPAVSVIDVAPTILELAIGGGRDLSGVSLAGLVEGTQDRIASRKAVVVAYDGIHGQPPAYAWVDGRAKFVLYAWREGEKTRLFDLQADAAETIDLRPERPGQEIQMRKELEASLENERRRVEEASGR